LPVLEEKDAQEKNDKLEVIFHVSLDDLFWSFVIFESGIYTILFLPGGHIENLYKMV